MRDAEISHWKRGKSENIPKNPIYTDSPTQENKCRLRKCKTVPWSAAALGIRPMPALKPEYMRSKKEKKGIPSVKDGRISSYFEDQIG
jgi:hypothetical protein